VLSRRDLLQLVAVAQIAGNPFRGVFPVLSAPSEVETLTGADGIVWPRQDRARIVIAAARRRQLPIILCVQGPDVESTRRHARHAESLAPDAVMAAPLNNLAELARHYRAIARECALPLVAHAAGATPVEFVLHMRRELPTLRMVKDEAGHTLSRISEYRRVAPDLAVFIGATGPLLADALERGAAGAMPCASS
jgi:dihydrodipicolinate synthase/N-acetylneuraminate lyase